MPTLLWDVRSQLHTRFKAALSSVAVEVWDGPQPVGAAVKRFVIVGSDGGDFGTGEGADDGARAVQSASPSVTGWRDEAGEVVCSVWAWDGGADLAKRRASVQQVLDICEADLLRDRTLDGLLTPPGLAEFGELSLREFQTSKGAVARAVFTVSYAATIRPS